MAQQIALEIVELYPYVAYMKCLLAGSVAVAMYVTVMIGGGVLYIDDKARGVHEGYLLTPITRDGVGAWIEPCRHHQGSLIWRLYRGHCRAGGCHSIVQTHALNPAAARVGK
jgi:hypothetical protein